MRAKLAALPVWAWKAGLGALVGVGGLWYWMQPSTFDECMLAEMRGQTRYVYPNAEKVCAARFGTQSRGTAVLPPGFVLDR